MDQELNMAADHPAAKLMETPPMISSDQTMLKLSRTGMALIEDEGETAPSSTQGVLHLHAPADHDDEDVMYPDGRMSDLLTSVDANMAIEKMEIERHHNHEVLLSRPSNITVDSIMEIDPRDDFEVLVSSPQQQCRMSITADVMIEIERDEYEVLVSSPPPVHVDANMVIATRALDQEHGYRRTSSTTSVVVEDEEYYYNCSVATPETLMDPRMYAHATTQGDDVDAFIQILKSISTSSKNVVENSKILSKISHRGNTCLHIAASFGHHELAKYIAGESLEVVGMQNDDHDTALHIAARKKDLSFVKIVMDSGLDSLSLSRDVETAEAEAEAEVYSLMLKIVNKKGNTVLHEALINHCKEEEVVEIIQLAKAPFDPQVAYNYLNKEGKSPLYLAAQANYLHVVHALAKSQLDEPIIDSGDVKAEPPLHAAILAKNKVMLEKILVMEQLVHQKDKDGKTPLHCAASIGYLEGVQKLLENQSNFDRYVRDNEGFCPIHVASRKGYVDIVQELLRLSPDSKELLNSVNGENFLHVAAKFGADNVVDFVFKNKWLENLINEKDRYGNTPLHLATRYEHPKVVNYLTWDKRVDLNLVNGKGQTALDIAVSVEHPTSFHQRLIWTALKSAGARPIGNSKVPPSRRRSKKPNTDEYKDRVNTLLLVSTLVVTVTFAAGFTMPGGYNSSNPNAGMATLLMKKMFHVFVICNTLALYTSILAAITLIWAQLGDLNLMDMALRFALPFLGVALTAMSLGFAAGVYLVVSNLHWLAIVVLSIGIICLVILFVPFVLLFLPSKNTNCILRYISYYPFLILVWASQSHVIKR